MACAHAIAARGIARVVVALRDPHPRVDGVGLRILRESGLAVIEGVCETEVRRQLGAWIVAHHPHAIVRDAAALAHDLDAVARLELLAERFGLSHDTITQALASTTRRDDALP
jgi:diaminohydroxyphosphoribosylaminopyrimidine deaminase / 5-amino-6-(5-phosphoribosylamino)uracil reductase